MRKAAVKRQTKETDIILELNLDGKGTAEINTGIGFFDHMLTALAVHGGIDLKVICRGDLEVDGHHTVEDIGIAFGKALVEAFGDKKGIERFACAYVPLDEALARCVMDISGRAYLYFDAPNLTGMIGGFDASLAEEFFAALCSNAFICVHIDEIRGKNAHHVCESIFKSFARALKTAKMITGSGIPSTKGSL